MGEAPEPIDDGANHGVSLAMPTKEARDAAFRAVDSGNSGGLSLDQIQKAVTSLFPTLNNEGAVAAAFNKSDKSGEGSINRREFRFMCEFLVGEAPEPIENAQEPEPEPEPEKVKPQTRAKPAKRAKPSNKSRKSRLVLSMPPKEKRDEAFNTLDTGSSGGLSLVEITKAAVKLWPKFNNNPALLRAYQAADKSGDGYINRREFRFVIEYLIYFEGLWPAFEAIDEGKSDAEGLSGEEFTTACTACGLGLSADEAQAEYLFLEKENGKVLRFDDFCTWIARKQKSKLD